MNSAIVRKAMHRHISRLLDDNNEFDENLSLQQLGLNKQDIEDLIFHLEDEFGLSAFTHEEDQLLNRALTSDDLCRFLLEISER